MTHTRPPHPSRAGWWLWAGGGALVVALAVVVAANRSSGPVTPDAPGDVTAGGLAFEASCGACHGSDAAGTESGPPLVHEIYRPSHHSDQAFLLAARRGVPQHHWRYGSMPPQPGITDEELADIVAYIRSLQREAGIE